MEYIQLQFSLINFQADIKRKRLNVLMSLSAPVSRTGAIKMILTEGQLHQGGF